MLSSFLFILIADSILYILLTLIGIFIIFSIYLFIFSTFYIALVFFIVYVSGISLLFLFVVMSYNLNTSSVNIIPCNIGLIVGACLIIGSFNSVLFNYDFFYDYNTDILIYQNESFIHHFLDIYYIGHLLYDSNYFSMFILLIILLLIALINCIEITNYKTNQIVTSLQYKQTLRQFTFNYHK